VATQDYTTADYGIVLSEDEQKRRFILKALLHTEGLTLDSYTSRFGTKPLDDYPELQLLERTGLAELSPVLLRLTSEGIMYSDAIGDWFISSNIRALMESCVVS